MTPKVQRIETKCENPECNNVRLRTQWQIRELRGRYCSSECSYKCNHISKVYTPEVLKRVQDEFTTLGVSGMSKALGVTESALKRQISKWRSQGVDIPWIRQVPVGTLRTWTGRDYVKTEDGWKVIPKPRKVRVYPPRQDKPKPPVKEPSHRNKTFKPDVKRLPDKVVTGPQKSVRIDSKTIVMVDADRDEEQVISEWYLKHNRA